MNFVFWVVTLTWPSPDLHLTFTWPGPVPELDKNMRTGNFVSRALVRVRQQKIYEDGTINPKTGKTYAKPQSHSFLYDHQVEDHNGVPPEFKLQSKRYYGKDRLACQVAEGVSIKMRTGKILNSKTDWDAPSLITIERNIHRGLWLWLEAIHFWLRQELKKG